MSTLYVDNLQPNLGSQVEIPDLKPLAGSVVQVLGFSNNTSANVTTTTITRVGDTVSITPTSSSSKILVTASAAVRWSTNDCGFTALHRQINSGSWAEIKQFSRHTMYRNFDNSGTSGQFVSFTYLDSPSTTDVVTYSWAMNRFTSGTGQFLPNKTSGDSANWTLMEIAQ
jgi:hypothetical protein